MKGPYVQHNDIESSVESIVKAFEYAIPNRKIRGRAKNGREFVSAYFPLEGNQFEDASTLPTRAFVQLAIRGSRRPYDVWLQFTIQEKTESGKYVVKSYDQDRAQKVLDRLKRYLSARPDKDDFIDDFRAF